jgi:seryl-tRNA synthetase
MLDLKFIREYPDAVRWAIQVKNVKLDLDKLLALDAAVRSTRQKSEQLAAQRRRLTDQFQTADPEQKQSIGEQSQYLAAELKVVGEELARLEGQLDQLMLLVPNVPDKSAPVGPDADSNVVVARWGEPPQFAFPVKDHVDLAERNNWVDLKRITEVWVAAPIALRIGWPSWNLCC